MLTTVVYCRSVTFKRKVDKTQLFGDEKPAPALGNLTTHYKNHHQGVPVPADVPSGESRGISATSAKIMADFPVDGKLNPAINSSQKNFYKIFAAWIIEDDLPFTTGETPGIQRLFAFLRARFLTKPRLTCSLYLFAVALDNAAPNDVLLRALSRLLREKFDIQFVPANSQIRCLAHVVNLVVQKLLAALEDLPDPDLVDDYLPNKDLPIHYDPDTDPDVLQMEQEIFTKDDNETTEEDDAATLMDGLASTFAKMSPLQKVSDLISAI
ncbi:hypothetical protein B0H14DRAFT_2507963 [Mycena olivaceomarginata]|nr:hypothetical protein B0H14DRAFT_2507963 [Mycena olivaceomarginata]